MRHSDRIQETLVHELCGVFDLDIASEDDDILIEALKRTLGDEVERLKLDLNELVRKLKKEYYNSLKKRFRESLAEVRAELRGSITKKQFMYLAATVFAESILNKPVPASLVFEILRCIGMEDRKNYPNRYYFLRQLEEKGLVKSITVVNSRADRLYCSEDEGKKIVDGSKEFEKLIELKERILNDAKIKHLIRTYSSEEPKMDVGLPKLLETSQVISEKEDNVKVLLYGREIVNISQDEINEIGRIVRECGRFTQSDLRKAYRFEKKAMAYVVYAYAKGWIRMAEKGRRNSLIFEVAPHELKINNSKSLETETT
ncbi:MULTISPECIES: hypothetical protein [unclassified Archaeoglobus]|jgi:hypothetical protein|uniref:hypothetical protein n=1 Tax=unclassified Archaeoglobus TaxID=2643606 RepID=UPI0025B9B1FC|nr:MULTISPECIES: hypothetical protein [unclassified Archaeoglobus]